MKIGDQEITFKLEHGNLLHIEIVNVLDQLRKHEILHDKKIAEARGAKALAKTIKEERYRVIRLINEANEKSKNG